MHYFTPGDDQSTYEKGTKMGTYYTVEIQAGSDDGRLWQALAPAERVDDWDGTIEDLAQYTAANQTLAERGSLWRIVITEVEKLETGAAVHYFTPGDEWLAKLSDAP